MMEVHICRIVIELNKSEIGNIIFGHNFFLSFQLQCFWCHEAKSCEKFSFPFFECRMSSIFWLNCRGELPLFQFYVLFSIHLQIVICCIWKIINDIILKYILHIWSLVFPFDDNSLAVSSQCWFNLGQHWLWWVNYSIVVKYSTFYSWNSLMYDKHNSVTGRFVSLYFFF